MREFQKLWFGQTVSATGSAITQLALPLAAALTLDATPEQMGLLIAAAWLPYLLFSLHAGAWADRLRRRPILIAADIGRALSLATIPLTAVAGLLRIEQLFVVAFVAGSLDVIFGSAYRPYIAVLVPRDQLVDANAKLALSGSVARVAGPSLGGVLVQALTAPIAIAFDAFSFVVSAISIGLIRATETVPPASARRSIWREIGEGGRVVVREPFIRTVAGIGLIFNFAITISDAVYILYATRVLGLDGALVGAVFTAGGVASILGATIVGRTTARFGIGPAMTGAIFLVGASWIPVLVAAGPPILAAAFLGGHSVLAAFGAQVFNVTTAAVYQAAIPDRLQGRVGGVTQILGLGLIPVAALLGGWLGQNVGLWNTIAIALGGQVLGLLFVVTSPLRGIRGASELGPAPVTP